MANSDEINNTGEVQMTPAPINNGQVTYTQGISPRNTGADSPLGQDALLRKKILGACTAAVIILAAIFVAIGISLFTVVPKISTLLDTATSTIEEIQDSYETIINTVQDIDNTVQGINKIDFDEFAEAVNGLSSVINKIGNVFK